MFEILRQIGRVEGHRSARSGDFQARAPEDAVDEGAVVVPRVAGTAVVVAVGEERLDEAPLGVGEVIAVQGWPPSGNRPAGQLVLPFIIGNSHLSDSA